MILLLLSLYGQIFLIKQLNLTKPLFGKVQMLEISSEDTNLKHRPTRVLIGADF